MRIRLIEKLWRHKVPSPMVKLLNDAISDGSKGRIVKHSVEILEFVKNFFDAEEDDYVISEIDEIIESINGLDDSSGEDDFDLVLESFYDFMDGYSIFLGDEEPVELELGEEKK